MKHILHKLVVHQDLTEQEALRLLHLLVDAKTTQAQIGATLMALRVKEESVGEVVGFVKGIREKMFRISSHTAIDVCGTGGDASNTFNISTAVSFVVAGLGVQVAKHGNRAISSSCGSADVLEALEVTIMLTPKQAEMILHKVGLVFLFAPLFHPSFQKVGEVRRELGVPTIFNLLGPFTNPAGVKRQLLGVPNEKIAQKLSLVGAKLGYERLCIVANEEEIDEVSIGSKNTVYHIEGRKIETFTLDPKELGFAKVTKQNLVGGDKEKNAQIIREVLQGKKSVYRDSVLINAAMALFVAGKIPHVMDGLKQAGESIDSGSALHVLDSFIKETKQYA